MTEAVRAFRPAKGVSQYIARGVEEKNYTKFLAFNEQLAKANTASDKKIAKLQLQLDEFQASFASRDTNVKDTIIGKETKDKGGVK